MLPIPGSEEAIVTKLGIGAGPGKILARREIPELDAGHFQGKYRSHDDAMLQLIPEAARLRPVPGAWQVLVVTLGDGSEAGGPRREVLGRDDPVGPFVGQVVDVRNPRRPRGCGELVRRERPQSTHGGLSRGPSDRGFAIAKRRNAGEAAVPVAPEHFEVESLTNGTPRGRKSDPARRRARGEVDRCVSSDRELRQDDIFQFSVAEESYRPVRAGGDAVSRGPVVEVVDSRDRV